MMKKERKKKRRRKKKKSKAIKPHFLHQCIHLTEKLTLFATRQSLLWNEWAQMAMFHTTNNNNTNPFHTYHTVTPIFLTNLTNQDYRDILTTLIHHTITLILIMTTDKHLSIRIIGMIMLRTTRRPKSSSSFRSTLNSSNILNYSLKK